MTFNVFGTPVQHETLVFITHMHINRERERERNKVSTHEIALISEDMMAEGMKRNFGSDEH